MKRISRKPSRRSFLQQCAAAGALVGSSMYGVGLPDAFGEQTRGHATLVNGMALPDKDWNLWIDEHADWENDEIYLPGEFEVSALPRNPPTVGWRALDQGRSGGRTAIVTLPSTVEEHFWGVFGARSYTPEEYRYAAEDSVREFSAPLQQRWLANSIALLTATTSASQS